jgi:hypothetical protein
MTRTGFWPIGYFPKRTSADIEPRRTPLSDNRQWKGIAPGGPAIKRRCASFKLRSPLGAENITVKACNPLPSAGGNVQVLNGGLNMR